MPGHLGFVQRGEGIEPRFGRRGQEVGVHHVRKAVDEAGSDLGDLEEPADEAGRPGWVGPSAGVGLGCVSEGVVGGVILAGHECEGVVQIIHERAPAGVRFARTPDFIVE
jgi:hypothetical protein